jgi:hypothetical protein
MRPEFRLGQSVDDILDLVPLHELIDAGLSLGVGFEVIVEVADLLRHKSIQMTERYAHLAPHNMRSAVETLGEMAISGPTVL